VTSRRLLSLLALFALLTMPFGHMRASAHGTPFAMAGHCHGSPAAPGKADRSAIDCAIACAAITPIGPSPAHVLPVAAISPDEAALPEFSSIAPEADPPPPRLARAFET
jgi:hypothetical protein